MNGEKILFTVQKCIDSLNEKANSQSTNMYSLEDMSSDIWRPALKYANKTAPETGV